MIRAEGEVLIQADAKTVFARLEDTAAIPSWRPEILEASARDAGTNRYVETMSFMGKKSQTFEVIEREIDRAWTVRAIDGFSLRPTQRFRLEPAEGGATKLRYEIELPVTGGFVLIAPMLRMMIPRKWREYAERLKTTIETRSSGRGLT